MTGIPPNKNFKGDCISEVTFDNWKSKYGGMEAPDVKRLKDLEEKNSH
jgi:putative transposase